jgi:aspartate/tyrosine/aromatic aminotransferase
VIDVCAGLQAEKLMLENGENKEYLPIEGLAEFNKATVALLLGSDNKAVKEGRVRPRDFTLLGLVCIRFQSKGVQLATYF